MGSKTQNCMRKKCLSVLNGRGQEFHLMTHFVLAYINLKVNNSCKVIKVILKHIYKKQEQK